MENVSTCWTDWQEGSKEGSLSLLSKSFFQQCSFYFCDVIDWELHPALRDAFPLSSKVQKEISAPQGHDQGRDKVRKSFIFSLLRFKTLEVMNFYDERRQGTIIWAMWRDKSTLNVQLQLENKLADPVWLHCEGVFKPFFFYFPLHLVFLQSPEDLIWSLHYLTDLPLRTPTGGEYFSQQKCKRLQKAAEELKPAEENHSSGFSGSLDKLTDGVLFWVFCSNFPSPFPARGMCSRHCLSPGL